MQFGSLVPTLPLPQPLGPRRAAMGGALAAVLTPPPPLAHGGLLGRVGVPPVPIRTGAAPSSVEA